MYLTRLLALNYAEIDAMKKELEEEYQQALLDNELKMAEMEKNFDDMLKEAEENDAVSRKTALSLC